MERIQPLSIVIANEVKQSHEIATPACRNFILLRILAFEHYGVQARCPAKAALLAMTAFFGPFRDCFPCLW
jgi:hypothetical protein